MNRWEKARQSLAKGERWGEPERKHLLEQGEISNNEVVVLFDPAKLVYEVKSLSWTNVEIDNVVSCIYMTPTLLHLPWSHVITACSMRRMLYEGSNYMSLYYLISADLKT
jgi:hypothetical protein